MRIIYLTDVHDAFEPLGNLLKVTGADLYLVAGDLIYSIFSSYRDAWKFIELQEYLKGLKTREGLEGNHFEVATSVVEDPQREIGVRKRAKDYLGFCHKAEKLLQKKYKRLEGILLGCEGKRVFVIPGNYDMDLRLTPLDHRDLHLRSMVFGGLKFAGYGGADVFTPGVPDHLRVQFKESRQDGELDSEPYRFFKKELPDLLLLHHPPYGFLDNLAGYGRVGSIGIRNFIDEAQVKVVLSGHLHEAWGADQYQGTFLFNPSNFGRFVEVDRVKKGGYFFDFIIEDGQFLVGTLRRVEGSRIYDLADYIVEGSGLRKLILDERRIEKISGRVHRKRHIRSISRYNRVKSFFLGYETEETQRKIHELRLIYRGIKKKGLRVAFDLLGSLNFGMAEAKSDIDLIVYLRGEECLPDPNDTCTIPPQLQAVFDGLSKRDLEIEVCDSIDLDQVEQAILTEDLDDTHLQRFIFYRAICRPINLRLIKEVENLLLDKPLLRKELESRVREYIRIMISSFRHTYSFTKYKSRLSEKGIPLPTEIEDALRRYLREA
jgi:Icc-related predicted phosphoesterase